MNVLVTDWTNLDIVLPIAQKYNVGIEVQEFAMAENLERATYLAPEIKSKLSQIALRGFHAPFSELVPASRDPLVRQVARSRIEQGYEIAKSIGVNHIVVHSGFFPKTYTHDVWVQNSYNFWLDFLADKNEINLIHMENVYEDHFSAIQELIDRINETYQQEKLTACLDIGHVNANSSRSFSDWIIGLGDRIRYVHVHNNDGILDDHWRLDKGKIQVEVVLDLLLKYSPHAVWTVETYLPDIEPSLMWLQARGFI